MEALPPRIRAKIEERGACWLWTAAKRRGYGVVWWENGLAPAHRVVYELLVGPIDSGLQLDHVRERCSERACVNPAHLEPVSHAENIRRGRSGSRAEPGISLPGPPSREDISYLAGLLEARGCFSAQPGNIGIALVCPPDLGEWLLVRFGGTYTAGRWFLRRHADVRYVLRALLPHLQTRPEAAALDALVAHLDSRGGSQREWRTERDRLIAAVRAARARGRRPAPGR